MPARDISISSTRGGSGGKLEDEKIGIDFLQGDVKERLAVIRRAQNIRKNRKMKD